MQGSCCVQVLDKHHAACIPQDTSRSLLWSGMFELHLLHPLSLICGYRSRTCTLAELAASPSSTYRQSSVPRFSSSKVSTPRSLSKHHWRTTTNSSQDALRNSAPPTGRWIKSCFLMLARCTTSYWITPALLDWSMQRDIVRRIRMGLRARRRSWLAARQCHSTCKTLRITHGLMLT